MATCLIALGSNLGDRAANLDSAVRALDTQSDVKLISCSSWHATQPMGASGDQREFLNGAALVKTSRDPADLLSAILQVEATHGRQRKCRWESRTLDLDLLLYDNLVIDSPSLTVPHPRMSFRRFVLEPAAEIAGSMIHPTTGWSIERLRGHLDTGANRLALLSADASLRNELAAILASLFSLRVDSSTFGDGPTELWPTALTTWMLLSSGIANGGGIEADSLPAEEASPSQSAIGPKLSILLDPILITDTVNGFDTDWLAVAKQLGRGPTLRIPAKDHGMAMEEAKAAIETVWPGLGP